MPMMSDKTDKNCMFPFPYADLKYAAENGIIDVSQVQQIVEMSKRKELLEKHPFQIWQGHNGKWYVYLPDSKKGRVQKERKTKKEIEDLVADYQRAQIENPTLKEIWAEACEHRIFVKNTKKATISRDQRFFNRHFGELAEKRIKDVLPVEYVNFLEEQVPKYGLSKKAFSGLKGVLKILLKRAKRRGFIDWSVENMFEDVEVADREFRRDDREDCREVYDQNETGKLVEYLISHRDSKNRCLLLILISGIRIGEAVTLKKDDLVGDVLYVHRTETIWEDSGGHRHVEVREGTKTDGKRSVVIHSGFRWLLDEILKSSKSDWLFENALGGRQDAQHVRWRLKAVCGECGVEYRPPHKLRKTYGTILMDSVDVRNEVGEKFVLSQMGHKQISTTRQHYYKDRKTIDQKRQIINGIGEFDWLSTKTNQGQEAKML